MRLCFWFLVAALATAPTAMSAAQETPGTDDSRAELRLEDAIRLAFERNAEHASRQIEIDVRRAGVEQAGLAPNPELSAAFENAVGTGEYIGARSAETTIGLSQTLDLGGKRGRRKQAAMIDVEAADRALDVGALDLRANVKSAFVRVLAAQEHLTLAESLASIAREVADDTAERLAAGRLSPAEEKRARIAATLADIEKEKAGVEFDAARMALAALWGDAEVRFARVAGSLTSFPASFDATLDEATSDNPRHAEAAALIRRQQAFLLAQQSTRVPDLTVGVGATYFHDTADTAFLAGISLPIPIRNRNQGAIREARTLVRQARQDERATRIAVAAEAAEVRARFEAAGAEAQRLEALVIPEAQAAFEWLKEGYRFGRFSMLEILDAERTLFDARRALLSARVEKARAAVEWERLTGAVPTAEAP